MKMVSSTQKLGFEEGVDYENEKSILRFQTKRFLDERGDNFHEQINFYKEEFIECYRKIKKLESKYGVQPNPIFTENHIKPFWDKYCKLKNDELSNRASSNPVLYLGLNPQLSN